MCVASELTAWVSYFTHEYKCFVFLLLTKPGLVRYRGSQPGVIGTPGGQRFFNSASPLTAGERL